MLTSEEIKKQMALGHIEITNLKDNSLDKPNSCRLTLGDTLYYQEDDYLVDTKNGYTHGLKEEKIPKSGFLLEPGKVYLAQTEQKVKTNGFVPFLNGKVSLSLLGISISLNNEYKDDYFNDNLLLCITCTKPIYIYPNMEIGNLAFFRSLDNSLDIGMLSGKEIMKRMEQGDIIISNKDNIVINPNSVNLTLNKRIAFFRDNVLDLKKNNPIEEVEINENGFYLYPDEIYMARTNEWTETYNLIPVLNGRSSLGRLGEHVHCSAGLGSTGYKGYWHLGLKTTMPLKIYPDMKCCQICYFTPDGLCLNEYQGKVQDLSSFNDQGYYENLSRVLKR